MSVKKLPVSFKANEQYIRDYITSKLNYSAYIKELVLEDMNKNRRKDKDVENNNYSRGFDF